MSYTYTRHIPHPPLDAYIDYLYYHDGLVYPRERMLPMTSPHLVINLGDAIQIFDVFHPKLLARLMESCVIGVWSISHIAQWPSNCRFFGVCFKPGEAYHFLQSPLSEFHNRFVPLETLWGGYAVEMRERLSAVPTIQAGFELLERLLLARLYKVAHGCRVVQEGVEQIARHHGVVSIRALSDRIGVSQNHLLRQFKRMVGVSPKELANLYRLRHALRVIDPAKPVNWAWIAQQSGYYDQPHLNKDFMTHLGQSPTDHLRLRRRAQAENLEQSRLLRTLPAE